MTSDNRTSARVDTAERLDELTGYSGSIQGTPLDTALDEQRRELWEVMAIVSSVAVAIRSHFGDWPRTVPEFPLALDRASKLIGAVSDRLDAGTLEDRALAIARASDAALAEVAP